MVLLFYTVLRGYRRYLTFSFNTRRNDFWLTVMLATSGPEQTNGLLARFLEKLFLPTKDDTVH